jgi:hypothetical protein
MAGVSDSEQQDRTSHKHIRIYTEEELDGETGFRHACRMGREVLDIAGNALRVGVTTDEIDRVVHEACVERECYSSPLNYYQFPKSVCTSVNEVICHGIPDYREIQDGGRLEYCYLVVSCFATNISMDDSFRTFFFSLSLQTLLTWILLPTMLEGIMVT